MFVSDRDQRRPPDGGRGRSGGSGGSGRKDDIVERARLERAQRDALRAQSVKALTIQRHWRGSRARISLLQTCRLDTEKKLVDLEKVTVMLKLTKGIDFVPPLHIAVAMLRPFVFVCRTMPVGQTQDIVLKFCALIISPLAGQVVAEKNIISYFCIPRGSSSTAVINSVLLRHLMGVLLSAVGHHKPDKPTDVVVDSIHKILGYGLSVPAPLSDFYIAVRQVIVDQFYWFQAIRATMLPLIAPLLSPLVSDENGLTDVKKLVAFRTALYVADELFALSIWIVEATSDTEAKKKNYMSQLGREIFTLPVLSTLLSERTLRSLQTWGLKNGLLERWSVPTLALPPSPHTAFHSGHWLVGNLSGLSSVFCAGTVRTEATTAQNMLDAVDIDRDNLKAYLAVITPLLLKYYVPGVLKSSRNGGGIVWMRIGVQLVASGIPKLLHEQLLRLLDPAFSRSLYLHLLVPFRQDVSSFGIAEDKANVANALSNSGVRMLRQAVIDKTAENNRWIGSKWASKIGLSFGRLFGGGSSESTKPFAKEFVNSSKENGDVCKVTNEGATAALQMFQLSLPETSLCPDIKVLSSLFHLWSILLPQASLSSLDSKSWRSLSSFAFSTRVVDRIWASLHVMDLERFTVNFSVRDNSTTFSSQAMSAIISLCAVLKIVLVAVDDSELYEHGYPLPLHQILRLVRCLKALLYKCLQDNPSALVEPADASIAAASSTDPIANQLAVSKAVDSFYKHHSLKVIADVLSNLYARWARRPFACSNLWQIDDANTSRIQLELLANSEFACSILTNMPWCIEFHQRLVFFRTTVDSERRSIQGSDTDPTYRSRGTSIRIRKLMSFEDGMNALDHLSVAAMKDRIVIHYINEFGEEEKGIDAGGLFKDFWTDISNRIFNPSFGLFSVTRSQLLYPNHNALLLYPKSEIERLYYFVGRVLGKALFENMTVQPQFAHFFLAFINGKYNFINLIDDLSTFDPELYKNLMFLKSYDGDLVDLCLTFSVSEEAYGVQKEVELIAGGSSIEVTSHNRHRYINLVAKYYLHDRIHLQAGAFFKGLNQVIRPEQLSIFCAPELQVLISGTSSGISVDDLKSNSQYAGGYHPVDRTVTKFWDVVESMEESDRALLLKFVTSCERPPSLGFIALQPPFTIQRVESDSDTRLPTASTCFNILKLPAYSNAAVLKEKLLLAIRSGSGFDLS